MKRMILLFVLLIGLFGASAGVSWFLQKQTASQQPPAAEVKSSKGFLITEGQTPISPKGQPASVRPVSSPSADNLAQMASSLRQQQETLRNREQNLLTR